MRLVGRGGVARRKVRGADWNRERTKVSAAREIARHRAATQRELDEQTNPPGRKRTRGGRVVDTEADGLGSRSDRAAARSPKQIW